jgi:hypothetical protein
MANYKNISLSGPMGFLVKGTADTILQATDWTQLDDSGLTSDCVALHLRHIVQASAPSVKQIQTTQHGLMRLLRSGHNGTRKNQSRYPRTQHRWHG